ncbi:hypothetical protein LIER_36894 [Lithospermum erythrorhizon]|uniref:Uncharacterized protein n=1 Tax=Lithospermum erythrorhizon TaxID=34254 RepID=A0AAV3PE40_LITER
MLSKRMAAQYRPLQDPYADMAQSLKHITQINSLPSTFICFSFNKPFWVAGRERDGDSSDEEAAKGVEACSSYKNPVLDP